jgi:hypothetical protein
MTAPVLAGTEASILESQDSGFSAEVEQALMEDSARAALERDR